MPRCLLPRHIHTALRPAPIRHARTHPGRLGAGVIAHHAQPATAALNVKGLNHRPGQAVVFNGLVVVVVVASLGELHGRFL